MQEYFGKIEALIDVGEVLRYAVGVCEDQGIVRQSYHFTPLFDSPTSERTVVHAHGFDPDWLKFYDDSEFRKSDPIPKRVMYYGAMLTWSDAIKMGPNTPENELFFEAMRKFGLIHGFGVPLFGLRSRNAYASFDFGYSIDRVPPAKMGIVRSISQAAHQRVCVLLEASRDKVELSQRETEVMTWIVRGKSLSVIGEILELSPDTVKTYAKRIYAKLGTTDRVGAVVKALKLGLVTTA
ncbi:LuxR family transcriptional regulator [Erythrobacter insulae]|uniref:LuxR family transcriptional regulator n=1 Tax=Erythrobacter insulae TaxID=2584124 RepID=A0A547P705_9SPHN|nr:LuxR family transcriptional regulator [Erythrobacter insulae]TRD09908.1 LuxR family transcriptional regulator [Erythrobacter insulae]